MRVENQTKTQLWEDSSLYAQKPRLKFRSRIPSLDPEGLDNNVCIGNIHLEKEQFDVVHGEDGSTVVHVLLQVLVEVAIMD